MKQIIIITIIMVVGIILLSNGSDKVIDKLNYENDISISNSLKVQNTLKEIWDVDKISNNVKKEFPEEEVNILFSAANRNKLTVEQSVILFAIRKVENGGFGREMGIINKKANTFDLQAGWCAATIQKNYDRWIKDGKKNSYIEFLGNRYCPTTGNLSNTEKELNGNWIPNIEYWVHRLSN